MGTDSNSVGFLLSVTCTSVVCSQVSAFQKTKEAFGGIDIVCNNAGLGDESRWRKMLDVNLVGRL